MFRWLLIFGTPLIIAALCGRPAVCQENADPKELYMQAVQTYQVNRHALKATELFKAAAELGNPDAQFSLGVLYEKGEGGLTKNAHDAIKWYEAAAINGNANAAYNLGHILAEGFGIKRNPELAVKWYEKAALLNHATAQYKLGSAYLEGVGVAKDRALAEQWIKKAAEGGEEDAILTLRLMTH